jgi:hypothetical protein
MNDPRAAAIELIHLRNPICEAVLAPDLGGRILSFTAHGREWLWHNPALLDPDLQPLVPLSSLPEPESFATWANFGGDKTWPAPQGWSGTGEWPGPPDRILDAGRYDVEVSQARPGWARLTSPADERTGLRIVRDVQLDPIRPELTVTSTLVNVSDRVVRWAAWEVTQVATEDPTTTEGQAIFVEVDPISGIDTTVLFEPVGAPKADQHSPGMLRIPVDRVVGKLGFPSATGRVRFQRPGGEEFTLTFPVLQNAEYPDHQSRFELWMQCPVDSGLPGLDGLRPDAYLVELECLSPMVELKPGGSVSLPVTWGATTAS